MEYDYEDESEIPDFQTFKNRLIEDLFKSAFFQQKKRSEIQHAKTTNFGCPQSVRQTS